MTGAEQRVTTRLLSMWETMAKEKSIPEFAHFNHTQVEDVWQSCMVLMPLPRTSDRAQLTLQLHHLGRKLTDIIGNAAVGSYIMAKAQAFNGSKIISRVGEMIDEPKPIEESGQLVNDKHKVVKYRSCLLPFGNATTGVTHVLVGLSWREF